MRAGPAPHFTNLETAMSEPQAPSGLMQAIAPIVKRRPVHIIVSDGTNGALHVVVQPIRVDDKEDAEVASGFSIEAPAEELDADLPQHLAEHWVPARVGLQSLLDQIKAAAEQTRQTTVGKAKEAKGGGTGRKSGGGADSGAQTSIAVAGAQGAAGPPAAVPVESSGPEDGQVPAPANPAPQATDPAGETQPVADAASAQPQADATAAEPIPVAAGDGVSDLFA